MSETDSFIDEVNEEVRRDRLYFYLKRYGWIGILLVVLIVAGAAWVEYGKSQNAASSEAFGDAVLAALDEQTPDARVSTLEQIPTDQPGQQAVINLLIAGEASKMEGGLERALQSLEAIGGEDLATIYPDVATYKQVLMSDGTATPEEQRQTLSLLDVPGNPMRLLAEEQIALTYVEEGDTDQAISLLQQILADAETTQDLRQRATQLIVALGGTPDAAG